MKDYRYKGPLTFGEEGSARNLINSTKSYENCKEKKGIPTIMYGITPCHDVYNYYGKKLKDKYGQEMVVEKNGELIKNPLIGINPNPN